MTTNLLIATSNAGKKAELQALLSEYQFRLVTPQEIGIQKIPPETGTSYLENAMLKARYYHGLSHLPVLADDTGLEVDALGGQPGLYSARFSPDENATDGERRELLLQKLSGKPKPWTAHFTCTAVLFDQHGVITSSSGRCDGFIIEVERGTNGFGYDAVFCFSELGKTMAELSLNQKNRISHRARAIQALDKELLKLSNSQS